MNFLLLHSLKNIYTRELPAAFCSYKSYITSFFQLFDNGSYFCIIFTIIRNKWKLLSFYAYLIPQIRSSSLFGHLIFCKLQFIIWIKKDTSNNCRYRSYIFRKIFCINNINHLYFVTVKYVLRFILFKEVIGTSFFRG